MMYSLIEKIKKNDELYFDDYLKSEHCEIFENFAPNNKEILIDLFANRERCVYDKVVYTFKPDTKVENIWERTRGLQIIKDTIGLSEIFDSGLCPICSATVTKLDIDHYFPKKEFEALILFPYNLTPCCGDCNTRNKSKKISFHPYFDELPHELIKVDFEYSKTKNKITFHGYHPITESKWGQEYAELFKKSTVSLGVKGFIEETKEAINAGLELGSPISLIIKTLQLNNVYKTSKYSSNNIFITINNNCILELEKYNN